MNLCGETLWHLISCQDTHKNSGSHEDSSDANFVCPHQILVAHLIVYFSYKNLTTHNIQKVLKKFRCSS